MLSSPIFQAIIISGVVSQGIKIVLFKLNKEKTTWRDIFVTGSMPSSHSALVSALSLSILLSEGFTSSFFISFVLASIVIRDSLGVRRSVGEEGRIINEIIKKSKIHVKKVTYSLGHKPSEVFAGIFIGLFSAFIYYLI